MKKTISILLAVLLLAGALPFMFASAAEGDTYRVSFTLPDGKTEDDIWLMYDAGKYPDFPDVTEGIFIFQIGADEKYDVSNLVVYANGESVRREDGVYAVMVDRDIVLSIPDLDGQNFGIKHFRVTGSSGDGYSIHATKVSGDNYPEDATDLGANQNYDVPWGGTYTFKVVLRDGYRTSYTNNNYTITVETDSGKLLLPGSANFNLVHTEYEKIYVYNGTQEDEGGRYNDVPVELYYEITNITEAMHIDITGVSLDTSQNIFTFLMNMLRIIVNYILNIFGLGN